MKKLLIIPLLFLSACKSTETSAPKKVTEKPKLPIEERPRLPHIDYSAKTEDGQTGIWVQPIGKSGEPIPDLVFVPMETN
jgi:hypothetical protein